jgi:hypothetical protein
MSDDTNEERLAELLATCMGELLGEMRLHHVRITDELQPLSLPESLTAFCGFGSTDLRGSVTILGSVPLFSQLHPLPATVTPRDLVDWACEFANQTVGRYRNRLLAYDVSLALGVPQTALAENVRLSSSLRRGRNPIQFAINGMVLETWLQLSIRPGFQLANKPADDRAAALKEGSVIFF